ncbi:Hypothetical predicted protein [Mytilus galloprovincialis]|uniref:HTH psq-type domain-containing protein n=1 Tax=Mytilus galloprovincialis TaxID=29158 RepID=A0A8B6F4H6_MYTGA|nr:Hypothetical predicted protein [Mytilus galloprovincialis]
MSIIYLSDYFSVYWRKKKQREYSPEKLEEAVQAVLEGRLSQNKAAHQYGVPQSTISTRISKMGASKLLLPPLFRK